MRMELKQGLRQVQHRYCVMALMIATTAAAILMASGMRALGKGLILGVLFSLINFSTMAAVLPLQFNPRRSRSTFASLGSIVFRFGLMAVPIIAALKSSQIALVSVIIGLFGVQIAILGDHLWARLNEFIKAK